MDCFHKQGFNMLFKFKFMLTIFFFLKKTLHLFPALETPTAESDTLHMNCMYVLVYVIIMDIEIYIPTDMYFAVITNMYFELDVLIYKD